jgi:hypothetical protein
VRFFCPFKLKVNIPKGQSLNNGKLRRLIMRQAIGPIMLMYKISPKDNCLVGQVPEGTSPLFSVKFEKGHDAFFFKKKKCRVNNCIQSVVVTEPEII